MDKIEVESPGIYLRDTPRPGASIDYCIAREWQMSNRKAKWWLAAVAICCLVPAAFADRDRTQRCDPEHNKHCQQVPEGGSAAIYLFGAGLTCFGAIFLRSRIVKPAQS